MKRKRTYLQVIVLVGAVCAFGVLCATAAPYEIALRSGSFVPPAESFELPASVPGAEQGRVHVLLQLWQHLRKGDRARF